MCSWAACACDSALPRAPAERSLHTQSPAAPAAAAGTIAMTRALMIMELHEWRRSCEGPRGRRRRALSERV
eukprot:4396554-Alexandrium_andersonii.AAC.1